jgi:cell division protein FtsW
MTFSRTDTSTLGRWWWTVDRITLAALLFLVGIGMLLTMTASPAVAERIGADSYHFVRRQIVFLPPAVALMIGVSLLSPRNIRRLASLGMIGALLALTAVLFAAEVKGASRWLSLGGLTLQPSEFAKPAFAVVAAWMFSSARLEPGFPGRAIATGLYILISLLLLAEPDVGQTLIISAIWGVEFFLVGLPMILVAGIVMLGAVGGVGAYAFFPHVQARVSRFLDPQSGDAYQVNTALNAFHHGGIFGTGPGEGHVKLVLPDAHTDFIMAVAAEEFGVLLCLAILALFALIVVRGMARLMTEENLFVVLAGSGLLVQFGLQSIVNMATTLRMMPAKGMTLPFISYGGSSMLALALGMGMMLALTRKRYGTEELES